MYIVLWVCVLCNRPCTCNWLGRTPATGQASRPEIACLSAFHFPAFRFPSSSKAFLLVLMVFIGRSEPSACVVLVVSSCSTVRLAWDTAALGRRAEQQRPGHWQPQRLGKLLSRKEKNLKPTASKEQPGFECRIMSEHEYSYSAASLTWWRV